MLSSHDYAKRNLRITYNLGYIGSIASIVFGFYYLLWPSERITLAYSILVIMAGIAALIGIYWASFYLNQDNLEKSIKVLLYFVLTTQLVGMLLSQEGFYDPYIFVPSFIAILIGFYVSEDVMYKVIHVAVGTVVIIFALEWFGIRDTAHPRPTLLHLMIFVFYMYAFRFFLSSSIFRLKHQTKALKEGKLALERQQAILEDEVKNRTQDLEDLIKQKNAFLSMLTHDMKNPLTTLGLYSNLIQKQPAIVQKKPHIADALIQNHKQLTEMVNNILDIETMNNAAEFSLNVCEFDLAEMLISFVDEIWPIADAERTRLVLGNMLANYDEKPPAPFTGDKFKLKRVISNLMSNAIKYSPPESMIKIDLDDHADQYVITVKDNGIGIPTAEVATIFDPYSRVEAHKEVAAGSGLGLSIVKLIVEAHDGKIELESTENVGSTFSICLPKSGQGTPTAP